MSQTKHLYLSYILDKNTPTYGNRNQFVCEKKSDISKGDVANDSSISTTVHMGTHIDMPYHFFEEGQTIEDFDIEFFSSTNILFINFTPKNTIINEDLLQLLNEIEEKGKYEFLIIKTGICNIRHRKQFWENNYGFDPAISIYLRKNFPNVRIFGFDSISVSSFTHRMLGREAHKAFLDPQKPILLLEDMDLHHLNRNSTIKKMQIAPLRIEKCDGLPCTVLANIEL